MIMTNNPIGSTIQDFSILNKIGSGGFATVYKARCLQPGYEDLHIAIKKISKKYINRQNLKKRVDLELRIHSYLNHPSIVKFYTSFEDENFVYLILELCGRGTLEEYLKSNGPLSEEDACHVIKQVIDGVRYLHSKYILHRDLSLKNILLTDNMEIKIADFGMAAKLSHPDEKKFTMLGTANFISPEVIRKSSYDSKADCWSVGCVLYALLYGTPPFDGKEKKYYEIMSDAVMLPLTFPKYASDEAKGLLSDLLNKDPKCRININAPLLYAFFRKYEEPYDKKSEFYSQKSSDSGMGSLSSSTTASSRSVHGKSNYGNGLNSYESDTRSVKLRSSSSVPINLHGLSSDKLPDCCHGPCNSLPRCNSALEHLAIREDGYQLKSSASRLKMSQFRNKIQALPSRKEIFESDSSKNMCIPISDGRQCMHSEEKHMWKQMNGHHNFPQQLNYSDERSRSESQLLHNVHIKDCPKSPLPYPHKLQNITDDHLFSNSYYSNYNPNENSLYNGNVCRYNNEVPCTNSKEYVHKNPSCSHEHYCAPENNCSHEMICSCHQHHNSVMKSRSNSFQAQNSYEKRSSPHLEITLERNFTVNRSLKDVVTPLTTVRLSPKRHTTKSAIVSILENGQVCLEFLKLKKNKKFVTHVCFISSDGQTIQLYKPKKNIMASNEPPPLPGNSREVQYFSFDNLPEIHWKKYQYAKRFIDIVRAKTPKVTIYGEDAKCIMMENCPNPDFEIQFFNGYQIVEVANKLTLTDENGRNFPLTCEDNMNADTKFMLKTFLSMKEICIQFETHSEMLSKTNNNIKFFPVIVGRRPSTLLGSQDTNKENTTPQSLRSSALSGAINAMKSYDGTISTDNSPFQSSFQRSIQSPVTPVGQSSCKLFRNIMDVIPSLKTFPKVENGKILTDYKDGIQMWSSKDGDDVCFYDINTRKRINNIQQNAEIMKRVEHDLPAVLLYILSGEKRN